MCSILRLCFCERGVILFFYIFYFFSSLSANLWLWWFCLAVWQPLFGVLAISRSGLCLWVLLCNNCASAVCCEYFLLRFFFLPYPHFTKILEIIPVLISVFNLNWNFLNYPTSPAIAGKVGYSHFQFPSHAKKILELMSIFVLYYSGWNWSPSLKKIFNWKRLKKRRWRGSNWNHHAICFFISPLAMNLFLKEKTSPTFRKEKKQPFTEKSLTRKWKNPGKRKWISRKLPLAI